MSLEEQFKKKIKRPKTTLSTKTIEGDAGTLFICVLIWVIILFSISNN